MTGGCQTFTDFSGIRRGLPHRLLLTWSMVANGGGRGEEEGRVCFGEMPKLT